MALLAARLVASSTHTRAARGAPPPRARVFPFVPLAGMSCALCRLVVPAAALPAARGCADARHTGLRSRDGRELSCAQLRRYCAHPRHGARVLASCPLTCGTCVRAC
eukprot:gene18955-8485_t